MLYCKEVLSNFGQRGIKFTFKCLSKEYRNDDNDDYDYDNNNNNNNNNSVYFTELLQTFEISFHMRLFIPFLFLVRSFMPLCFVI
jgi:lipopolysaccharide export LptBFGC system permease protein LptF